MTDVELTIEKPAAGGRMLARLEGQVTLVAGAIPGERVRARIDGRRGGVLFATVVDVLDPSPDRRPAGPDPACGGRDYAHITAERQLALKAEIVRDAFRRIAHVTLPADLPAHASPAEGYRMRARLHGDGARVGFYREGSHVLCDPACTGQLRADTLGVLAALEAALRSDGLTQALTLDLAENREATGRVLLLDVGGGRAPKSVDALLAIQGVTGIGVARDGRPLAATGVPSVCDTFALSDSAGRTAALRLERHVTAFFQGNRFLVQPLVERVLAHVPDGPLTDLYAGVGLFGLAHAALGKGEVVAVEGEPGSADDLHRNAGPYGDRVRVEAVPVEVALRRASAVEGRTVIVDPPRTGLSRDAAAALATARPRRLVYVSCDVATLARDVGRLIGAGFEPIAAELFDLFPGTAHVETVVAMAPPDPRGRV